MGQKRDIVVVGAGLGGMTAIAQLASAWPKSLQVAIVIAFDARGQPPHAVLEILQNYAPFQMRYARDGEEIRSGRIYLGPPDAHAVVAAPGVIRFEPSAMFETSCPSADRLFASAAAFYGERVIAVLLTGATHDGLRGVEHVERAGGIGIIQDPAEASAPAMPGNVMRRNHPDYCVPVGRMAALIARLVDGNGD